MLGVHKIQFLEFSPTSDLAPVMIATLLFIVPFRLRRFGFLSLCHE